MRIILIKISVALFIFLSFAYPSEAQVAEPIKVLLVPGHDNESWGAQYVNLKEAAMNLAVGRRIYNILKKDQRFEVYVARDSKGYTKEFLDYFTNERANIISFKNDARKEMHAKIQNGTFIEKENPPHNSASEEGAIKLYGFNKWANENGIDAVIHLHFNDYPRPYSWTIGKHKGFVIYMPDGELVNWKESAFLAANIFSQLNKKYTTSTYKEELGGLIPDQKLIALGANATLSQSVRSILIEYGYIYEKRFRDYKTRHKAYDDMAELTATGIKNYFFSE